MGDFNFQTRGGNFGGELNHFSTLEEAKDFADNPDNDIWKISFPLPSGERIRLVKGDDKFEMENIRLKNGEIVLQELSDEGMTLEEIVKVI